MPVVEVIRIVFPLSFDVVEVILSFSWVKLPKVIFRKFLRNSIPRNSKLKARLNFKR